MVYGICVRETTLRLSCTQWRIIIVISLISHWWSINATLIDSFFMWIPHSKQHFFIHQLTREIWQQMFPGVKGQVGNFMETVMLKMNRNDNTITVSESTKCDLIQVGFDPDRVVIAPEGLVFEPWLPEEFAEKEGDTLLYAGRINPYKGVEVCIQALAKLRAEGRTTRLWVVGKGDPSTSMND